MTLQKGRLQQFNEEGMYKLLFSNQQPIAKSFRKHCCNVMFPHIQRAIIGIQRQHYQQATQLQQTITDRDNQSQAIQYEIVGLQCEIKNARKTVTDLTENSVLCVFEKNKEDEKCQASEHPYYMVRFQKRVLPTHKKWLKICYPNITEKGICDNAHAIHAQNRFRTRLGRENWYRNHFSLPDEQCEFFGDLFDVDF